MRSCGEKIGQGASIEGWMDGRLAVCIDSSLFLSLSLSLARSIALHSGAHIDEARVLRTSGWSYVVFPEQGTGSQSDPKTQDRIKVGLLTHQVGAVAEVSERGALNDMRLEFSSAQLSSALALLALSRRQVLVSTALPSTLPLSEFSPVVRLT